MTKNIISRADYINGKATHDEYYGQFVNEYTENAVLRAIGKKRILESKNEHFNDIPLELWDNINYLLPKLLRDCGDYPTLSAKVCILKCAAKIIKTELQILRDENKTFQD